MTLLKGSSEVTDLVIGNNMCPFENVTTFDVTKYPNLKSLKMGNNGFWFVNKVNFTGLNGLESVEIGKNSFTQCKGGYDNDPNRHFYLKNCPKLKSLKIGRYSFSDYSVIEIENVNALETIEMGDLSDKECNSFRDASLTLRDLPALRTLVFGRGAFSNCLQAVFENLPELESIRMGYSAFAFGYENTTKLVMKSCACSVR